MSKYFNYKPHKTNTSPVSIVVGDSELAEKEKYDRVCDSFCYSDH